MLLCSSCERWEGSNAGEDNRYHCVHSELVITQPQALTEPPA